MFLCIVSSFCNSRECKGYCSAQPIGQNYLTATFTNRRQKPLVTTFDPGLFQLGYLVIDTSLQARRGCGGRVSKVELMYSGKWKLLLTGWKRSLTSNGSSFQHVGKTTISTLRQSPTGWPLIVPFQIQPFLRSSVWRHHFRLLRSEEFTKRKRMCTLHGW